MTYLILPNSIRSKFLVLTRLSIFGKATGACLLTLTLISACGGGGNSDAGGAAGGSTGNNNVNSGVALSARSITTGGSVSTFRAVVADSSGNALAAGSQAGSTTYTYAPGVSSAGSTSVNIALVKYDSSGIATWAKTVTGGSGNSTYNAIALDSSGNVYAAGFQTGGTTFTYGPGITATGAYSSGTNALVVKYDSSGNALWARTTTTSSINTTFLGIAVDSTGNVYVVGTQNQSGSVSYAAGVSVAGSNTIGVNAIIVKYNNNGDAQWARASTNGGYDSAFSAISVDGSGNPYAAGYQSSGNAFTYPPAIVATGSSTLENVVLVKYNSAGDAQWAKTTTAGSNVTRYTGIAIDSSTNIYATGYTTTTSSASFATGVSVSGQYTGNNALLVKYDSSGTAQWAKSVTVGTNITEFTSITIDSTGFLYAAGRQVGTGSFSYDSGISATGPFAGDNITIVKYSNAGAAQWAKSTVSGSVSSSFNGVAVGGANLFGVGVQFGNASLTYASGISLAGAVASVNNSMIIRYGK